MGTSHRYSLPLSIRQNVIRWEFFAFIPSNILENLFKRLIACINGNLSPYRMNQIYGDTLSISFRFFRLYFFARQQIDSPKDLERNKLLEILCRQSVRNCSDSSTIWGKSNQKKNYSCLGTKLLNHNLYSADLKIIFNVR